MSGIGELLGPLYAISELLLMDRMQPHEVRPQNLFVQARRTVTRCGVIAQALSLIKVIMFVVCVRKDSEAGQFKPSFIDESKQVIQIQLFLRQQ